LTGGANFAHRRNYYPLGESMQVLRCAVFAATLLTLCAGGASARPLEPAESYDFHAMPYDAAVLHCDDGFVLNGISFDFGQQQFELWHTNLKIESFDRVGEIGFRNNGPEFIPRRYCIAHALFNDGRERTVKYNVINNGGFIGINRGVEFCVVGLDHNHAYSPACSAAGP
jgi:hypothetical protein